MLFACDIYHFLPCQRKIEANDMDAHSHRTPLPMNTKVTWLQNISTVRVIKTYISILHDESFM